MDGLVRFLVVFLVRSVLGLAATEHVGLEEEVDEEGEIGDVHERREQEHFRLEVALHALSVNEHTEMSQDRAGDDELQDLQRRDHLSNRSRHSDLHRAQEVVAETIYEMRIR